MRALPSPLLAVTDRHGHPRPLPETVARLLDGGCRWVWFRERDMEPGPRRALAEAVLARVRAAGGVLGVGGDPALAAALGADGVHLGGGADETAIADARRRLEPGALVGVSAHSGSDLAAVGAADYATLSPIFASASKPGYGPALGRDGLRAGASLGVPVVALGGLTPERAPPCRRAGAAGLAVMGRLMRAHDPAAAARDFLRAWARGAAED